MTANRSKPISQQQGSVILTTLVIAGILGIVLYLLVGFLKSRRGGAEEELQYLQAKALSSDVLELGKYFLSYEQVIFLDDPLAMSPTRSAVLSDLASQSYGSVNAQNSFLTNACGGYDANAEELGDLRADNHSVFCPYFIRNPMMDGAMFENMMLRMWSSPGSVGVLKMSGGTLQTNKASRAPIMSQNSGGSYSLTLDLKDILSRTDDARIRLHLDQNIVKNIQASNFTAKLKYTFYGPSAGFDTISNERFVTIESMIEYGQAIFRRTAGASESMILFVPTVKDFAIFLVYPESSSGVPTHRFSEALKLGGATTQVYGRVFFNGDIDMRLEDLPTFYETVVISGDLQKDVTKTYQQTRDLFAQKFRKGLVVRFPAEKLIHDGECVAGLSVANQSGMYCKNPLDLSQKFGIANYISNLGNICSQYPVNFDATGYTYTTTGSVNSMAQQYCKGSAAGKVFLSGGSSSVTVNDTHAFIISPVQKLELKASASIYGTILGGQVIAPAGSKFYALTGLRSGLPGISDATQLAAITGEGTQIKAGVAVPLVNMPLIERPYLGR